MPKMREAYGVYESQKENWKSRILPRLLHRLPLESQKENWKYGHLKALHENLKH